MARFLWFTVYREAAPYLFYRFPNSDKNMDTMTQLAYTLTFGSLFFLEL